VSPLTAPLRQSMETLSGAAMSLLSSSSGSRPIPPTSRSVLWPPSLSQVSRDCQIVQVAPSSAPADLPMPLSMVSTQAIGAQAVLPGR